MKSNLTTGVAALLGAAMVAGFFYLTRTPPAPPAGQPAVVADAPTPAAPADPAILYPVPQQAQAAPAPLPPLDSSDNALRDALVGYFGKQSVQQLFGLDSIVRRIVATVDNLPRETVATRLLPTRQVSGSFLVSKNADGIAIAPANAARYQPYVALARRTDAAELARIYSAFYPLFQGAYVELGYPKGYFNDRMVAVIDHLLAAPVPAEPVMLTQPHVLYKFADAQFENASAGHKIMLRMGSQNALVVKAKLREIRAELTRGALPTPARQ